MKKGARFFCENCGAEVPRSAKNCPQCGRIFSSVKCPSCGFVGEENQFKHGCPSCGTDVHLESSPPPRQMRGGGRLPLWVWAVSLLAFFAALGALLWKAVG